MLSGVYEDGIGFERYETDDFTKSVNSLNLAFGKKLVLISKKAAQTKNDIEMFKYSSSQKDETVKYRTTKDGFAGNIRIALIYYGLT